LNEIEITDELLQRSIPYFHQTRTASYKTKKNKKSPVKEVIYLNKENSGINLIDKIYFYFQRLFSSSIKSRRDDLSTFIFEEFVEQQEPSNNEKEKKSEKKPETEKKNEKKKENEEDTNEKMNSPLNFNVKLYAIEILTSEAQYNKFWNKILSPIEPIVEHKVVNSNNDPNTQNSEQNESHLWVYKYSFSSGPLLYLIIEKSKKKFFSNHDNLNKISSLHFTAEDLDSLENFLSKKYQVSRLSVDQQFLYQSFVGDSDEDEKGHILENQILVNVSGIDFLFVKQSSVLF
jgi:hypothetical protein